MKNRVLFIVFLSVFFGSCKEEYDFPLKPSDKSVLVVEGVINASGATSIMLSQSMKIDENVQIKPVLNAQLAVEGKDNTSNALSSAGAGKYVHPNLTLTEGAEYRLRIKANGKEYLSEWVVAKKTQPIDSISWERTPQGINFSVSTHDPSGNRPSTLRHPTRKPDGSTKPAPGRLAH